MKLAFELPREWAEKLLAVAERLGFSPEHLARAALPDLLATPDTLGEVVFTTGMKVRLRTTCAHLLIPCRE